MEKILLAFGFDPVWVDWILKLPSSAFFSIMVNGTPSSTFKTSRGIREGDPLLPFIFVIMMEGLGHLLKAKIGSQELKGLTPHPGLEPQSHQQFVDDTMLMGKDSVQEA